MEGAAKLITLVLELYKAFGPVTTVIVMVLLIGTPFLLSWLRDRKLASLYERLLHTKEDTIQRLAADNRSYWMRELEQSGMTREQIDRILPPPAENNPLTPASVKQPVLKQAEVRRLTPPKGPVVAPKQKQQHNKKERK